MQMQLFVCRLMTLGACSRRSIVVLLASGCEEWRLQTQKNSIRGGHTAGKGKWEYFIFNQCDVLSWNGGEKWSWDIIAGILQMHRIFPFEMLLFSNDGFPQIILCKELDKSKEDGGINEDLWIALVHWIPFKYLRRFSDHERHLNQQKLLDQKKAIIPYQVLFDHQSTLWAPWSLSLTRRKPFLQFLWIRDLPISVYLARFILVLATWACLVLGTVSRKKSCSSFGFCPN